jgi:hypothetical protein
VRSELYAPIASPHKKKEPMVPTGKKAGWAREPVWTWCCKEEFAHLFYWLICCGHILVLRLTVSVIKCYTIWCTSVPNSPPPQQYSTQIFTEEECCKLNIFIFIAVKLLTRFPPHNSFVGRLTVHYFYLPTCVPPKSCTIHEPLKNLTASKTDMCVKLV